MAYLLPPRQVHTGCDILSPEEPHSVLRSNVPSLSQPSLPGPFHIRIEAMWVVSPSPGLLISHSQVSIDEGGTAWASTEKMEQDAAKQKPGFSRL